MQVPQKIALLQKKNCSMIDFRMTEGIAYAFFLGLAIASFAIGFWLQKVENARQKKQKS